MLVTTDPSVLLSAGSGGAVETVEPVLVATVNPPVAYRCRERCTTRFLLLVLEVCATLPDRRVVLASTCPPDPQARPLWCWASMLLISDSMREPEPIA